MAIVHPTSIVDPKAELAQDVWIGPFCVIGPDVRIGSKTRLLSHVTVFGPTHIGEECTIWPQAILGGEPQDLKFKGEPSVLRIGPRNDIRESVTMHRGTLQAGGETVIESDNLFMSGVHIAHDCRIGSHVVIANQTQLAGHVRVQDHVSIGGMTGLHHYVTIGQYAYVGGMSRIVHDVPPFMIAEGHPCRIRGVNVIGLQRRHFPEHTISRLKEACRKLFRGPVGDIEPDTIGNLAQAVSHLRRMMGDDPCIKVLLDFVSNTSVGVFGRYLESTRSDHRYSNPVR
ncbi:MAG: acyl-ACP--UDP-N-acetylglucosamine O-acyltransferase [Phycisphaeraceae bacterium]|nr:acyl-ACP--UDP-N-acetylglucosamine O-acyltransferase [Phycisphaeraceae bacterium]